MAPKQAVFLEGNLFRHIAVMSLTASVGLMAVFIVDFVDMIFISMLGKSELAAAVGYAGAILFFTSSFGIGMAIAAGALVARALGAGDVEEARRKATNSLIYGVIFGALFAALVWFNLRLSRPSWGRQGTHWRLPCITLLSLFRRCRSYLLAWLEVPFCGRMGTRSGR